MKLLGFLAFGLIAQTMNGWPQDGNVERFTQFLSSRPDVASLRFTRVDCSTGRAQHFQGACMGDNFFVREYHASEDTRDLITATNLPQSSEWFGKDGDDYWQINGITVTKVSVTDSNMTVYKLASESARNKLYQILSMGMPAVLPGTFTWEAPRPNSRIPFSVGLDEGVKVVRTNDGTVFPRLPGWIAIANGLVSEMRGLGEIHYEYPTGLAPIPQGLPSKIVVGKSDSQCEAIFHIHELVLGVPEGGPLAFRPETKFSSSNLFTLVRVQQGERRLLRVSRPPPELLESQRKKHEQSNRERSRKGRAVGIVVLCASLAISVALLLVRRGSVKKQ